MDAGRDEMRTEWTDGSVSMEGTFNNIIIDKAQLNNWRNNGPHDSHISNMKVIDAS